MRHLFGRITYWIIWPAMWLWFPFTTRTRVIISLPDSRILFVRGGLSHGGWGLPGGGLRRNEPDDIGAAREVYEETGIELQPSQLQKIYEGQNSSHGIRYKAVFFWVDVATEPALKLQRLEVSEAAWLPPDQVDGLSPLTRRLLDEQSKS